MSSDTPTLRRELDEVELLSAIVDGINRYVRELQERGLIPDDRLQDGAGSELCDRKYEIAADVARRWLGSANQTN
jgi:hypothetical protein